MEIRKITGKVVLIILGIFFAQSFLNLYLINIREKNADEYIYDISYTYDEEYQKSKQLYIESFKENINNVIKQANTMGGISIFSKKDSFSEANLEVTKNDYKRILDVEPVAFNDIFLIQFFDYTAVNGFILLAAVFIVLSLIDSKKDNMKVVLYSAKNGRGRLIGSKVITMLFCDVAIVSFFYIGNLIVSAAHFGGFTFDVLSYPIQSLSLFDEFPYAISIGEFLIEYILYKSIVLFAISQILWLIMYTIDNMLLAFGMAGLLGGLSYLIYALIDAKSVFNILRYCNPWYMMLDESAFSEYKNLNWFESAVNKNVFIEGTILVLLIVGVFAAFFIGIKKHPKSSNSISFSSLAKVYGSFIGAFGKFTNKLSIEGYEYYKVFVRQKGLIVVAILIYIVCNQVDLMQIERTKAQTLYYEFMEKYEGPRSEESEKYIEDLRKTIEEIDTEYAEAEKRYLNDEISGKEWNLILQKSNSFENERMLYRMLSEQQEYLDTVKYEDGIDVWYVNVLGYNHLFTDSITLANIATIFAVILLCSSLFAYEKQYKTVMIVRGSKEGREKVYRSKMQVAVVTSIVLFLLIIFSEIFMIDYVYELGGFGAPAQSLHMLRFVPIHITVGEFVFLVYLFKGLIIVGISLIIARISMNASRKQIILTMFILCVPTILSFMGMEGAENYSLVSLLSIGPMTVRIGSIAPAVVATLIIVMGAIVSVFNGHKKWCYTYV